MTSTDLYRSHLETLDRFLTAAIEQAGRKGLGLEGVLFHAGRQQPYYADDETIPFFPTPHFRRWAPLAGPDHVVLARPGRTPEVVRVTPDDFWFDTSPPPRSYWEEAVELHEVASFEEAIAALGALDRVAYVGSAHEAAAELGIPDALVEPPELMAPLDWHRATKTEHEVELLAEAAAKAAAGHQGGREVFAAGGSELEVYWAYLEGSGQVGRYLPFSSITALDEKASILHYQHKRGAEAAPGKVLLLDAGAAHEGYASDVTRTWTADGADPVFERLVEGVDALERRLVAMVTPGRPYLEIHLASHREIGALLAQVGVLTVSAEEAVDKGLTRAFYPHGVGHHLGIQVHDAGGHQAGPEGGTVPPPDEHPMLRNTRILEPGHVVTIEPGIYFIPMLLDPLRAGTDAGAVDWDLVERLIPHGGVRIEDDVVCTEGAPRDLTRPLIGGPAEG